MKATGLIAQFSPYALDQAVAAGAYLVPAAQSIIMGGVEEAASVAFDLTLYWDVHQIWANEAAVPYVSGFIGSLYCEGTNVKFKNNNATQEIIHLRGLTIA